MPKKQSNIDISKFINKIIVNEEVEAFIPTTAFNDLPVNDVLKRNITAKGYTTPTPIQDEAIPYILAGRDIVGIANTGTGKTGAFLIPLINKIVESPKENVLIVVPTRELATQINQEFKEFARGTGLFSVCCVGGASISGQIRDLRRRNHVVIGTPGRMKDLFQRRSLDLARFNTVVLDEADRMLDMGFINDMRFLLSHLPKRRHTLFFSATLSRDIENIIGDFLVDPIHISVKTQDTAKNVDQDIVKIAGSDKIDVLQGLLSQKEFTKVLVFGRTKHGVEKLSKILAKNGFNVQSIHGNKSHYERQKALALFSNSQTHILVATDVAARGLDIEDISHVINYDLPNSYDDYVHRIGRTGRGDKKGKALTFVG
ncbi:MAG: DEAD/DEAH box helicase [Candidatus Spechtbacterales bacterium]